MASHITTNPENVVDAGATLEICMNDDKARAGQSIALDLQNGGNPPAIDSVDISLDEDGNGCVEWTVPTTGWDVVDITDPGGTASAVSVAVNHP